MNACHNSEITKHLFTAITSNPDDTLSMLALADLYEECDDDTRASCWRWMARYQRRPSQIHLHMTSYYWNLPNYNPYRDGIKSIEHTEKFVSRSNLPLEWIEVIKSDTFDLHYRINKFFFSLESAYNQAVEAFTNKMTKEQRETCLSWTPPTE